MAAEEGRPTKQLRHRDWGVFQGECLGLAFFHPQADMPEQGYCPVAEGRVERALRRLTAPDPEGYGIDPDLLSVEPFDAEESARLIREGARS